MTRQIVTPIQSFLTVSASKLGATTIKRIKAPGSSSQSAVTVIISRWIEKNIMLNIWLYGRICIFPLNEVGKVGKFRISVCKFQVRFTYYLFSIKAWTWLKLMLYLGNYIFLGRKGAAQRQRKQSISQSLLCITIQFVAYKYNKDWDHWKSVITDHLKMLNSSEGRLKKMYGISRDVRMFVFQFVRSRTNK